MLLPRWERPRLPAVCIPRRPCLCEPVRHQPPEISCAAGTSAKAPVDLQRLARPERALAWPPRRRRGAPPSRELQAASDSECTLLRWRSGCPLGCCKPAKRYNKKTGYKHHELILFSMGSTKWAARLAPEVNTLSKSDSQVFMFGGNRIFSTGFACMN